MSTELTGKLVKGPSGRHLGRVTEESASRFCVEVDGQPVWLPRDIVFSVEESELTVIFEPPSIGRYALQSGNEKTA